MVSWIDKLLGHRPHDLRRELRTEKAAISRANGELRTILQGGDFVIEVKPVDRGIARRIRP